MHAPPPALEEEVGEEVEEEKSESRWNKINK
jgi:hypothetical protein